MNHGNSADSNLDRKLGLGSVVHHLPAVAGAPGYSGDWAELGEPAAGTPAE